MAYSLMINNEKESLSFEPLKVIYDKDIYFVKIKQNIFRQKKEFLSNIFVMVGKELVTTNLADTRQLIAELKLFEKGNQQNTFTSYETFGGNVNLKLQLHNSHIYIFKAEAENIVQVYNDLTRGKNMETLLNNEYTFTLNTLTELLGCAGFLGWHAR